MESETSNSKTGLKAKWQWKSNSNPWSNTEESQWTTYPPEQNYLIEMAYYNKQKEVDLGEYIVSIQHLIQKKKSLIITQRPIRRILCEGDEMKVRSERYFETERPKTINHVFGDLGHFIGFFSRRNPEILDLATQFQEIEQSIDLDRFNTKICPQIVSGLEEELLKPIEEQLKNPSMTMLKKKIKLEIKERNEELITLFRKKFASLEDFYGVILKSYTMNTDLYRNLNKYLRNQNWTAIDNLLPYVISLCKAFFNLKLSASFEEKRPCEKNNSMILYRGTALDELSLSSYQTTKASKLFSWNSVTSTTINREMAENFMYLSAEIENKIYPVLFIIEIPLKDNLRESEYLNWIDIHQYSAIPNEGEVILPPGSTFELENISTDTDTQKRSTIKLKLKQEVKSLAHGGLIMQGVLQTEMMSDKQAKIVSLEGKALCETLNSISGNRLIEEIEFCLCIFDHKSLEELLYTLPTLDKAKRLKFVSCKYEDEQEISNLKFKDLKSCNILEIESFDIQDFYEIFCNTKENSQYWKCLKVFHIDCRNLPMNKLMLHGLRNLSQLTSLSLNFEQRREIKENDMHNLISQGLKYLNQIVSLNLNFSWCTQLSEEAVNNLAIQGLRSLTKLTSLTINFSQCDKITNRGVENLASQGLRNLTQLTLLNLNLTGCSKIGNKGMHKLGSQGLKCLTKLSSLSLNFSRNPKITSKGVESLASQGLKSLTRLASLTLNFSECPQVSDDGAKYLALRGLKSLAQLTSLNLAFYHSKVRSTGVSQLAIQGLRYLSKLTSLNLDFSYCEQLTDKGMNHLVSQGLKPLTELNSLSLNFCYCKQITNEVVHNLASKGLKNFSQLTSLTLNFSYCLQVTDDGVKDLASQALRSLSQLACLTLSLSHREITNEGVYNLASEGLKYLEKLTSLTLNFRECSKITDEGVANLASQGLKYLTQLTSLNVDFSSSQISDEGMKNLTVEGIQYLTELTSLNLSLFWCKQISEQVMNNLIHHWHECLPKLTSIIWNNKLIRQIHKSSQIYEIQEEKPLKVDRMKFIRGKARNRLISSLDDQQASILDMDRRNLQKSLAPSEESMQTEDLIENILSSIMSPSQIIIPPFEIFSQIRHLTSLTLKFPNLDEIRNEKMINFASQGFQGLTQLTSLALDFSSYGQIINEGVKSLAYQGFQNLSQLTSLNLNLSCSEITDQGVNCVASQGLKYLTKLTSLTLNFRGCSKVTDEGMKNFASQGLRYLTKLTSLTLDFIKCPIVGRGLNSLISYGIKYLIQLDSLTLFCIWMRIPDHIVSNIIRVLGYFGFLQE